MIKILSKRKEDTGLSEGFGFEVGKILSGVGIHEKVSLPAFSMFLREPRKDHLDQVARLKALLDGRAIKKANL